MLSESDLAGAGLELGDGLGDGLGFVEYGADPDDVAATQVGGCGRAGLCWQGGAWRPGVLMDNRRWCAAELTAAWPE